MPRFIHSLDDGCDSMDKLQDCGKNNPDDLESILLIPGGCSRRNFHLYLPTIVYQVLVPGTMGETCRD